MVFYQTTHSLFTDTSFCDSIQHIACLSSTLLWVGVHTFQFSVLQPISGSYWPHIFLRLADTCHILQLRSLHIQALSALCYARFVVSLIQYCIYQQKRLGESTESDYKRLSDKIMSHKRTEFICTNHHTTNECTGCMSFILGHFFEALFTAPTCFGGVSLVIIREHIWFLAGIAC